MKQIKFIIREFLEAYREDDNFRDLLRSLYKVTLFSIISIMLLIFFAWFILELGKIYI